jgi:hypothetical protein
VSKFKEDNLWPLTELSAREFCKTFVEVLKGVCFVENKSDPCLLSKWEHGEVILIGIYVDDCNVVGKEIQISILITDLKNGGFNLKITQNLTDFLSCHVSSTSKIFDSSAPSN